MKCRLIAAGTRLPPWVDRGFVEYQKRLRTPLSLELLEITVAPRRPGENPLRAMKREGAQMSAVLGRDDYVVALEVLGRAMDTAGLSAWLAERLADGRPLAFLIGGPDGLTEEMRTRAQCTWSLSPLTLPHGLARIVVVEQLYRAMSLLAGHPYHRA